MGPEGTPAYHRSRPRRRRSVADEVLRDIRSRGPSEEDEGHRCSNSNINSNSCSSKRLSCDEIDFILGDIRRRSNSRSRSRSSRPPPPSSRPPPPPTSVPPDLPEGAGDWLPFGGQKAPKISRGRARRKRPKSVAGVILQDEGYPKQNDGRAQQQQQQQQHQQQQQDGKEWLNNPVYESKPQSRNAKTLPPDDNGAAASSNPAGSSSSPAASSWSSKPTELANDLASREEEDGLRRDDRGKDLNERLNDEEEGGDERAAMGMVRRLKERLRDMDEELGKVRAAADRISVEVTELESEAGCDLRGGLEAAMASEATKARNDDRNVEEEEEGEYTVEEPDEGECEVRREGLVITEVTSPTPMASPRIPSTIRPRPHSLWGELEGGDLFGGKRYGCMTRRLFVTLPLPNNAAVSFFVR